VEGRGVRRRDIVGGGGLRSTSVRSRRMGTILGGAGVVSSSSARVTPVAVGDTPWAIVAVAMLLSGGGVFFGAFAASSSLAPTQPTAPLGAGQTARWELFLNLSSARTDPSQLLFFSYVRFASYPAAPQVVARTLAQVAAHQRAHLSAIDAAVGQIFDTPPLFEARSDEVAALVSNFRAVAARTLSALFDGVRAIARANASDTSAMLSFLACPSVNEQLKNYSAARGAVLEAFVGRAEELRASTGGRKEGAALAVGGAVGLLMSFVTLVGFRPKLASRALLRMGGGGGSDESSSAPAGGSADGSSASSRVRAFLTDHGLLFVIAAFLVLFLASTTTAALLCWRTSIHAPPLQAVAQLNALRKRLALDALIPVESFFSVAQVLHHPLAISDPALALAAAQRAISSTREVVERSCKSELLKTAVHGFCERFVSNFQLLEDTLDVKLRAALAANDSRRFEASIRDFVVGLEAVRVQTQALNQRLYDELLVAAARSERLRFVSALALAISTTSVAFATAAAVWALRFRPSVEGQLHVLKHIDSNSNSSFRQIIESLNEKKKTNGAAAAMACFVLLAFLLTLIPVFVTFKFENTTVVAHRSASRAATFRLAAAVAKEALLNDGLTGADARELALTHAAAAAALEGLHAAIKNGDVSLGISSGVREWGGGPHGALLFESACAFLDAPLRARCSASAAQGLDHLLTDFASLQASALGFALERDANDTAFAAGNVSDSARRWAAAVRRDERVGFLEGRYDVVAGALDKATEMVAEEMAEMWGSLRVAVWGAFCGFLLALTVMVKLGFSASYNALIKETEKVKVFISVIPAVDDMLGQDTLNFFTAMFSGDANIEDNLDDDNVEE
jgi:hypothetical protein